DGLLGDAADLAVHDRVGAPLVAGGAVGVPRVDLVSRHSGGFPQRVEQDLPAVAEVPATAQRLAETASHGFALDGPEVLGDLAEPAELERRALLRLARAQPWFSVLPPGRGLVDPHHSGERLVGVAADRRF